MMNKFEKEISSVLKKMKNIFPKKQSEKKQLSGQSSSIRSRYEADEKSKADLFFEESLTKASTLIARRTRSNIAAREVDVKGKKGKVFQGFKSRYLMTLIQMRIQLKKNLENLKKKSNNLLNKLRLYE